MRSFVSIGAKFSAHGHTWVAGKQIRINPHTAFEMLVQVWTSNKTWMKITCRYDVRKETITWHVDRFSTAKTRSGAAALAAEETKIELERALLRLGRYGSGYEKQMANRALKKRYPNKEIENETTQAF